MNGPFHSLLYLFSTISRISTNHLIGIDSSFLLRLSYGEVYGFWLCGGSFLFLFSFLPLVFFQK